MESKDMGTFIVISKSSFKAWLLEVQARTDYWVSYTSLGIPNLPNTINWLPHLGRDVIIEQIIDSQFLFLLCQKCKEEFIYRLALCLSK